MTERTKEAEGKFESPSNLRQRLGKFFRTALLGSLMSLPLAACGEKDNVNDQQENLEDKAEIKKDTLKKGEISIDGKIIQIKDLDNKRKKVLTYAEREMVGFMSDEAKENIQGFKKDEKLVKFAEGTTDEGYPFQMRETAANAYKLAEKYAEAMGYCLEPISSYRTLEHQNRLYKNASKKDRGGMVAKGNKSNHRNGSAVDLKLCKIVKDKKVALTPIRGERKIKNFDEKEVKKLELIMNLAGFVRFKKEEWHFELGSPDWYKIMEAEGTLAKEGEEMYAYESIMD